VNSGIYWAGTGSFDLHAVTSTGNGNGIYFTPGAALAVKVRASTLSNNSQFGLQASTATAAVLTLDLGTTADPGGSTLTGNTSAGLSLNVPATDTDNAVGNTWTAGAQSADTGGHYAAGTTVTGPTTGANYTLLNASTLNL
jgi:hypothetical protein